MDFCQILKGAYLQPKKERTIDKKILEPAVFQHRLVYKQTLYYMTEYLALCGMLPYYVARKHLLH